MLCGGRAGYRKNLWWTKTKTMTSSVVTYHKEEPIQQQSNTCSVNGIGYNVRKTRYVLRFCQSDRHMKNLLSQFFGTFHL